MILNHEVALKILAEVLNWQQKPCGTDEIDDLSTELKACGIPFCS